MARGSDIDPIYRHQWPDTMRFFGLRQLHMWDMARSANITDGQAVLELGAGAWPYYRTLGYSARVGETGRYVATDIDPEVTQIAQTVINRRNRRAERRGRRRKAAQEELVTADAGYLPFPNDTFDTVLANNLTASSWYEREAFRVLKAGGRIQVSFAELALPFIGRKNRRALREAGFTNLKIRPGMPSSIPIFINWVVSGEKPLETKAS